MKHSADSSINYRLPVRRKITTAAALQWLLVFALLASFLIPLLDPALPLVFSFRQIKWYVLIAFYFISIVLNFSNPSRIRSDIFVKYCLMIFIIVASISTMINAIDVAAGISRLVSFFMLWSITFLHPAPAEPRSRVVVWTSAYLALMALVIIFSVALLRSGGSYSLGRYLGVTSNANTLGTMAAMVTVGAFALFYAGRMRIWFGALILAAIVILVLTGSRSASVGAMAGVLAVIFGHRRRAWRLAPLILVLWGALYLIESVAHSDRQSVLERELNIRDRQEAWQMQIDAFYQSPFIGNGLQIEDNWQIIKRRYEGSYTSILAAAGVLGGFPYLLAIFWGTLLLYRRQKPKSGGPRQEADPWSSCAFGMTIAILVNSIGEGYLAAVGSVISIYVWIMLGLPKKTPEEDNRDYAQKHIRQNALQ